MRPHAPAPHRRHGTAPLLRHGPAPRRGHRHDGRRAVLRSQRGVRDPMLSRVRPRRTSVPLPRPFSLAETVTCHGWYQLAPFTWVADEKRLWRAERAPDGSAFAWSARESAPGKLALTAYGLAAAVPVAEVARRARIVLNLDLDLAPFHALSRKTSF